MDAQVNGPPYSIFFKKHLYQSKITRRRNIFKILYNQFENVRSVFTNFETTFNTRASLRNIIHRVISYKTTNYVRALPRRPDWAKRFRLFTEILITVSLVYFGVKTSKVFVRVIILTDVFIVHAPCIGGRIVGERGGGGGMCARDDVFGLSRTRIKIPNLPNLPNLTYLPTCHLPPTR